MASCPPASCSTSARPQATQTSPRRSAASTRHRRRPTAAAASPASPRSRPSAGYSKIRSSGQTGLGELERAADANLEVERLDVDDGGPVIEAMGGGGGRAGGGAGERLAELAIEVGVVADQRVVDGVLGELEPRHVVAKEALDVAAPAVTAQESAGAVAH